MNTSFWQQIHGGSTHFSVVLLLISVVFDFAGWRSRDEPLRRGLHSAGFGSAVVGTPGVIGAVIAGLILTRGRVLGSGYEMLHDLFVWPAFSLCVVTWRLFMRRQISQRGFGVYLAGMSAAALMTGAGYWGGEMFLGRETGSAPTSSLMHSASTLDETALADSGRQLFLENCAHCHGSDAHGDEGPDLRHLDWTDEQIAARIRNGKKGEMIAFAEKFSSQQIRDVVAYLRTLK